MQVTSALWKNHIENGSSQLSKVDPTVVFTTESTSVVKEQQAFVAENGEAKFPFNFEFITNTKDVTPDSGFMKDIGKIEVSILRVVSNDLYTFQLLTTFSILRSLSLQQRCHLGCRFNHAISDVLIEGSTFAKDYNRELLLKFSHSVE
jgi:hypothetical protein